MLVFAHLFHMFKACELPVITRLRVCGCALCRPITYQQRWLLQAHHTDSRFEVPRTQTCFQPNFMNDLGVLFASGIMIGI